LYLGTIALLRAQHASSVPLLKRYGYVKDTIAALDQAKQLSGGQVFVVNWIAGIVHTKLPGSTFTSATLRRRNSPGVLSTQTKRLIRPGCGKSTITLANSRWMMAIQQEPRNIYDGAAIPISLTRSHWQHRFQRTQLPVMRLHRDALLRSRPGRVYALSGFEFTEYYFVLSKDRHQLISIDSGTRTSQECIRSPASLGRRRMVAIC
jgi:hypothetical protein